MSDVPAPPPLSRTIAFMNQKGGVGKTTTTVNLAAALAANGRKTLIVDLDPQAHASLHLGYEPGDDDASVYDLLIDRNANADESAHEVRENLRLIPAETDLAAVENEIASEQDRHFRLRNAINRLHDRPEFVLLDCPPSLGLLTLNALVAAREVVIPMQAHYLALQGVGKLLETVSLVRQELNPRLRVTGVVLCMHDTQTTHTQEVVADLEDFFEQARGDNTLPWRFARVFRPAIRRNIKLAECPSFGQTIFDYAPQAAGADDYNALARVLIDEWDRTTPRLLERKPSPDEPAPDRPVDAPDRVEAAISQTGAGG